MNLKYFICFTIAIVLGCTAYPASAGDILTEHGAVFVLHGDKAPAEEIPKNLLVAHGGKIIPGGVSGNALRLDPGEYLVLDLADKLTPGEGTLMIWVRPHWQSDSPDSHTFLSFTWSGDDKAYFTLSRGWWEPKGGKFTYFIFNNMESGNVGRLIHYDQNAWTHLTCTWSPEIIRLYVNGFKTIEHKRSVAMPRLASSILFLGSDQGSKLAKPRWADSDLDELALFQRALNDEEIFAIFQEQNPLRSQVQKKINGKIYETRAIFDEGVGWASEAGARKTIERIKPAGFNVYVPCVWHGQGTRYPSAKAFPAKGFSSLKTDPLKRLIKIAHENNLEVHPWFCVALREKEFFQDFYARGTPKRAFDLHRPAFRAFMADLIADVVRRYDVDGINLDYIRTMGLCTCDFCQQEYQKTTGRNLLTDISHPNQDGTLQADLQRWQDEAVEAFVRLVKETSKALKPRVIISIDGHPRPDQKNQEGRQEVKWANAGLVDAIFNMEYLWIPDFENHNVICHLLKDPSELCLVLANYQWDKTLRTFKITDPGHLVRLVDHIPCRWPGGVGVYIYSLLSDAQIEALAQGPFKLPARPSWHVKAIN